MGLRAGSGEPKRARTGDVIAGCGWRVHAVSTCAGVGRHTRGLRVGRSRAKQAETRERAKIAPVPTCSRIRAGGRAAEASLLIQSLIVANARGVACCAGKRRRA